MASFDELHRHASRGGVVGETHQQLGDTPMSQRLSRRGAVALGHSGQAQLRVHALTEHREIQTQICRHKQTTADRIKTMAENRYALIFWTATKSP